MTDTSACGRIEFHILWCRDCVTLVRSRFRDQVFDQVSTFGFGPQQNFRLIEFRTRIGFSATTTHVYRALFCEGQFVAELITFASTSLGAAKVRDAAISIPGFADQEQENKTRGLQEPQFPF